MGSIPRNSIFFVYLATCDLNLFLGLFTPLLFHFNKQQFCLVETIEMSQKNAQSSATSLGPGFNTRVFHIDETLVGPQQLKRPPTKDPVPQRGMWLLSSSAVEGCGSEKKIGTRPVEDGQLNPL